MTPISLAVKIQGLLRAFKAWHQYFSNFHEHMNYLGILLKCRPWSNGLGTGTEILYFYPTCKWSWCCWSLGPSLCSEVLVGLASPPLSPHQSCFRSCFSTLALLATLLFKEHTRNVLLPRGLCISYSFCLECSCPRYPLSDSHFLHIFTPISPFQRASPWTPDLILQSALCCSQPWVLHSWNLYLALLSFVLSFA